MYSDKIIQSINRVEELISEPTQGVIDTFDSIPGDVIVLGVAGKMGPSLARMIKRASDAAGTKRRVIGVSRFSSKAKQAELQAHGIETIECDLLDESKLNQLPDAPNVFFMAGMKFGSTGQEAMTWAMNTYLPALAAKKYAQSRIVALSTGNIYGLTPVERKGSLETDVPAPVGEYAMSCLGRERMLEHFSRKHQTRVSLIRLNYACDLRYGVMVDLAQRVWGGAPIDLAMSEFNTIWQGDANAAIAQALGHADVPPFILNLTGPEQLNVRTVCDQFGKLMNKTPRYVGSEGKTSLLSNAQKYISLCGTPRVGAEQMLCWVADWVMRDNPTLGKPTHFESTDGKF